MKVNYTVKGDGPTIVLLHGWGGSINSLSKLQDYLADMGFQVFNLDLPGFGQSEMPKIAMTLDDYTEYVHTLIDKLNIYKPILVGHSFGGQISMNLAIQNPKLLSKLVLVNSAGIHPKNSVKKGLFYMVSKVFGAPFKLPGFKTIRPLVRKIYYKLVVRESDYLKSGSLEQTFKNVVNTHLDDKLRLIQTDTLIIWGENDTYTPLWQGQTLAQNIKNSRLEVIHGARHALPLDDPEIVAKIIYSFLNSY